jgi:hypothetical protein
VLRTNGSASHALPEPTWSVCAGGTFAWGALHSNECPANYFRIVDEGACRSAAAAAGKNYPYEKSETDPSRPKGCYAYYSSDRENYLVYLNMYPTGGTVTGSPATLLCSGAYVSFNPILGLVGYSQWERPKLERPERERPRGNGPSRKVL